MIFFTYIPYDSTILIHFAWWTDPFSTAFPHETRDLFEGRGTKVVAPCTTRSSLAPLKNLNDSTSRRKM
jgi:hypothetical protein